MPFLKYKNLKLTLRVCLAGNTVAMVSKCHKNDNVFTNGWAFLLLSRSSLEPLISLDLVSTKLCCFRARVHCYCCLYIIFSANPVRRSEELRDGPFLGHDCNIN